MNGIRKFTVDIENLTAKEKILVKKLVSAAELIAPLYLKQKNSRYPGANFYPHDAKREEIEKAAKKNKAILNPYTFVEKNNTGSFLVAPFHIKFKKELKTVVKYLLEGAVLADDKKFSLYLKSCAKSLLDGSYEKSDVVWLDMGHSKFGFVIGPIERYLDKLFFTKCAYQSWVGILDEKRTKEVEKLKNLILLSRKKILPGSEKVELPKLDIRVDKTIIFSGLIADFMFTGTNLPNDVNLMEKYGSSLTIFETSLDEKFKKEQFPVFKGIFSDDFQKSYTEKELYEGSLRCIVLHEISHSLIRYRDAEKRLRELFPILDELYAYILGIKGCGLLLLKGAMTQKELEAILITYICRNFTWWLDSIKNPDVNHYAIGSAISQNFFLREGALKEKNGISLIDMGKLSFTIDKLSSLLGYHLALGSYGDAKEFIGEYSSLGFFKKFSPRLKKFLKK